MKQERIAGARMAKSILIIATGVFVGLSAFHVLLPLVVDAILDSIEEVADED